MYQLHSLGWSSFQDLCLTILREILGQTVESFLSTHDGGRDGAFAGKWKIVGQEDLGGHFVVQCKFTGKQDKNLRASDLSDEVTKVRKLVRKGICDSYVLMTNAGVTAREATRIKDLLSHAGVKRVRILGSSWICQQVSENKRLRMMVPRMYGLGDLSQILDERAYTQARAILESMREDLAKVIVTKAYRMAVDAIRKHGFVLLVGEPAAGKTTIASLLAMAAIDQWGASLLKLDSPSRVSELWNPDEPSQFFWLDDAFGVTQYEEPLVFGWNHVFPQVRSMLRKGSRIVMTSRDYIYRRARGDLKESAFPLLNESQVVVDVQELTVEERRHILYNHVKLGNQPITFRKKIKPYLDKVATHRRFIPETARRLADPFFTRNLQIFGHSIEEFVDKQEQLLREVIRGLDSDSKAALALIYMRSGKLDSPIALNPSELQALNRLDSSIGGCIAALEALRGTLVFLSHASSESVWMYKHPTIGDAYASILAESPEYIDILIQGSSADRLVRQVTCGNVGIENAVIVPISLFPQVLSKLQDMLSQHEEKSTRHSMKEGRNRLHQFLARRCSKEFLKLYLQHDCDLLTRVSAARLSRNLGPELDLANRLHEFDLLPERHRRLVVETICKNVMDGVDAGPLSDERCRYLFSNCEFEELLFEIEVELIPRLEDLRFEWESNYSPIEMPQDYMDPFLEFLDSLKEHFTNNMTTLRAIEHEEAESLNWVGVRLSDLEDEDLPQLDSIETVEEIQSERSIFDDIDADENSENA